jgi:formylmethanofuran dehydrogenase subunit E
MKTPDFFDKAPLFRLYDPLGDFLGAFEEGLVEIGYLDCVKLAGHSCPTVAGAYLMAWRGLEALYGLEALPVRSGIRVEMRAPKEEGVTGVIGHVVAYICGAGDSGGFSGIGTHFGRRGLLHYGVGGVDGDLRLTRLDTGASVTLRLDTSVVGGSPEMMPLMQKALRGEALPEERKRFQELWQGRVEAMLTAPELWEKIALITETNPS